MIRLIRTTTPATTQVRRVASWRVGQTTLRSSKRDSDRNSRVSRPFALNMNTASAATRPPTTAPMRSPVAHWRSEDHKSELQLLTRTSYAVFSLKKTKKPNTIPHLSHIINHADNY